MRKLLLLGIVVATMTMAFGVPRSTGAGATSCAPGVALSSSPDTAFNQMFASYGNNNRLTDDWTGGDGTYSIPLPDGRDVWMFSDTFLGKVNRDGSRPTSTPLINNDYVLQSGSSLLSTLHGGSTAQPTALIVPTDADWYWVGDATVESDMLRQFVSRFVRTGPGMWDWRWDGTDIATFSLPDLTLQGTTPAPSAGGVDYGAGLLEDGAYTYLYGVEDLQTAKYLHIARAPTGDLLGPWTFWDGTGWSGHARDSARVMSGVSNSVSVVRWQNAYVLLTQDSTVPFSSEIVAYASCDPQGPFTGRTHVYTTPETGGNLFTYGALAHPEFTNSQGLLVSYNVNSFNAADIYRSVSVYRPRFIRVKVLP
jgi:hypothetical protein